jgi:hypothetical protein
VVVVVVAVALHRLVHHSQAAAQTAAALVAVQWLAAALVAALTRRQPGCGGEPGHPVVGRERLLPPLVVPCRPAGPRLADVAQRHAPLGLRVGPAAAAADDDDDDDVDDDNAASTHQHFLARGDAATLVLAALSLAVPHHLLRRGRSRHLLAPQPWAQVQWMQQEELGVIWGHQGVSVHHQPARVCRVGCSSV